MHDESSEIEIFPPDIDNRTISEVLNALFNKGDRIQVFEGAQQINATGSFLKGGSDFFLWRDGDGSIRFQYLGGAIGIRKLKSDDYESEMKYPTPDYNGSEDE